MLLILLIIIIIIIIIFALSIFQNYEINYVWFLFSVTPGLFPKRSINNKIVDKIEVGMSATDIYSSLR